jgi:hypothetical protein
MLTAISAVAKRSLNRPLLALYSQMSQAQNGVLTRDTNRQHVAIPYSSRLVEGRALAQDVWSIFKYITTPFFILCSLTCYSAANLPPDCLNLGQGYMNFAPPKWITTAAEEALNIVGPNHYSHPKGRPRLRQAIKQFYGPQFNRDLDIDSEILVTSGANEGKKFSEHLRHRASLTRHVPQGNTLSSRPSWNMEMKSLCLNHSLISICHPLPLTAESPYMSLCTRLRMTFQSQLVVIGPSILKNYGQPPAYFLR